MHEEAKFLKESMKPMGNGKASSVASESRSDSDEFLYPSYSEGLNLFMQYAHLQETIVSDEAIDEK